MTTPPTDIARLLRLFHSLPNALMRSVVLVEHLCGMPVETAVDMLDTVLRRAARGDQRARDGVFALVQWLALARKAEHSEALIAELDASARESGHTLVASLLSSAPAVKMLPAAARMREVCISGRQFLPYFPAITRMRARSKGDDGIHVFGWRYGGPHFRALCNHPDPKVIGRLLDDKCLEMRHVQWIASRRPTTPAIVHEVIRRPRWLKLAEVREAVVSNPFTPTAVAAPMAATLLRPALMQLVDADNVHPDTLMIARCFLAAAA